MKPQLVSVLLVRAIGLCVLIMRLPDFLALVGLALRDNPARFLTWMLFSPGRNGSYLSEIAVLAQLAIAVYMLLGGKRLVRFLLRGLPGVPGLCERCGYDIAGLEGGRCPECGAKVPAIAPERP
jgi:hypothetical protein